MLHSDSKSSDTIPRILSGTAFAAGTGLGVYRVAKALSKERLTSILTGPGERLSSALGSARHLSSDSLKYKQGYMAARGLAPTRGTMTSLASESISTINKAKKVAGAAKAAIGKPLLYGLAGAAAISMLAGGVSEQPMEPPARRAKGDRYNLAAQSTGLTTSMMRHRPSAERDMRPESLATPSSVGSMPAPPGIESPVTYLGNQAPMGMRVSVSADTGQYQPSQVQIAGALNRILPGGRSNITMSDNRSKLTAQNLSEMLEGF